MPEYQQTGRRLKRNHSNASPRYVIAYDTETRADDHLSAGKKRSHTFSLGCAKFCRMVDNKPTAIKLRYIWKPVDFWQLVEECSGMRHTTWIISHSILYDMVVSGMAEKFLKGELVIDWPRSKRKCEDNREDNQHCSSLCVIDNPPTIIAAKMVSTQGRIVFVDSLNWFPVPLKVIGESLGKPKLKMPDLSADVPEWFEYCQRDTEIIFDAFTELIAWVKDNDFGMFRYTGPSQAMSAFRHRFMKHDILIHDNDEVKKLERRGYFGGRTEVFRIGEINETVHQLDVCSLFPSVMRDQLYPCKLDRFHTQSEYTQKLPDIDFGRAVAAVTVETENPIIPVFGEKGIIYPIGRFRTVLTGPELELAYRNGWIKEICDWAEYELKPIFRLWVDELWAMRQRYKESGNALYEQFVKRLMNSLYGKFAQRSPDWVNVQYKMDALPWSRWVEKDYASGEVTEYRSFGWQVQKHVERDEIAGTFVAISSFVSAQARMRMNYLRHVAGQQSVYYQGVDSLIVTTQGQERLQAAGEIDAGQLGKLRHELSTNTGEIVGHSDYRLGEKLIISGRALDHTVLENGTILQRKFAALSDLFSGSLLPEMSESVQVWQRQTKYHKGIVGEDGWIQPFVMTTPVDSSIGGSNSVDTII